MQNLFEFLSNSVSRQISIKFVIRPFLPGERHLQWRATAESDFGCVQSVSVIMANWC